MRTNEKLKEKEPTWYLPTDEFRTTEHEESQEQTDYIIYQHESGIGQYLRFTKREMFVDLKLGFLVPKPP